MMAGKRKDHIVADGRERVRHGEIERIRHEVMARHAATLANAGFFRRLLLLRKVRREIKAELERIAPRNGLYLQR